MAGNEKTSGLTNLKTIHKIQVSGEMQELLRDLRSTKGLMEELVKNASRFRRLKQQEKTEVKAAPVKEPEVKAEPVVEKVEALVEEVVEVVETKPERRQNNFENRQDRNFNNKQKFQNQAGQNQKSFNNQRNNFTNGPRPQGNRPFAGNGNNNFQRPFNNNAGGNRPFGPKPQNGFASSKGNAFKSFAGPLEDSKILAMPEKTFAGKKAPVKGKYDEKNKMSKKALVSRGFIVDEASYAEEIDGVRMGSRKLVKTKKAEKVFVAPAIESAVITTENVTVKTLSEKTGKPVTEIIKKLMLLGVMATINSSIDYTTAENRKIIRRKT